MLAYRLTFPCAVLVMAAALAFPLYVGQAGQEKPAVEPAASPGESEDSLAAKQELVKRRYERFVQTLRKVSESLKKTDPERAELLRRAVGKSNELRVEQQLSHLVQLLGGKDPKLGEAVDSQTELVAELQMLLDLLLSEDRAKELAAEKKRLEAYIKDLNKLIAQEKDLRAATERGEQTDGLTDRQRKIAANTGDLTKKMDRDDAAKRDKAAKDREEANRDGEAKPNEGQPGESKDGESKDGQEKSAEKKAKDGQPGAEKKDGEPKSADAKKQGEGKQKEGESKDGQSKDGQSKDGQSKDGQSKEAKDKDGQNKNAQSKDGQSKDSQSKDKQSKDGQSKAGQSKDGQQKDGQQKQGQQKQGQQKDGQQKDGEQQEAQQEQEQQDQQQQRTPGREELEKAKQEMERAIEKLKEQQREDASDHQDEAIRELQKAKEKLEEILRQLREEEKERVLAALEARFQRMLAEQLVVYEGTRKLGRVPETERTSQHQSQSLQLSQQENQIVLAANKVITLLHEEGTAVALPEAVEQMRDDMQLVTQYLQNANVGELTQSVEKDIIDALQEIIESLQREMEKKEDKDREKQKKQKKDQQQQQEDQALVDQIAELKMLRSLQLRVNNRTRRLGRLVEGEQANQPDVLQQLNSLAERQARIQEATYNLATGKNR